MSVFQFDARGALPIKVKVTANTVTTIVDATNSAMIVPWFEVNENTGAGTHNLTVDINDGTSTFYLGTGATIYNAKAVTGGLSLPFTQGYVIPKGSKLRVTSSDAAGKFDVNGTYSILAQ